MLTCTAWVPLFQSEEPPSLEVTCKATHWEDTTYFLSHKRFHWPQGQGDFIQAKGRCMRTSGCLFWSSHSPTYNLAASVLRTRPQTACWLHQRSAWHARPPQFAALTSHGLHSAHPLASPQICVFLCLCSRFSCPSPSNPTYPWVPSTSHLHHEGFSWPKLSCMYCICYLN